MNLKKLTFGLVALVGFGLMITLNAFTGAKNAKTIQYQYISNSANPTDVKNIANWQEVDGNSVGCGDSGDLVCRYSYNGDIEAFEDFLALPTTTPSFLADHADATKE
jgi:hypothetical protein